MIRLMNRNLKLYFRDRGTVLFSLLAVFIVIGLYTIFLGDTYKSDLLFLDDPDKVLNAWLIAGVLAVASVTTTLGAFGVMVEDRARKISKDFHSSPVSRISIMGGYLGSAFITGVVMSMLTLILAQGFLLAKGGEIFAPVTCIKVIGLIMLCTLANTALVCFIVSFLDSHNAFTNASTVIGTLIGFLTGMYVPVGSLPDSVQMVVKLFPATHGAAMLRQVITEDIIAGAFSDLPVEYAAEFKDHMGITLQIGSYEVTTGASILILIGTVGAFFGLSLLNMMRRNRG